MSITATVHNGCVAMPPELKLPDGTEVEVVVRPSNGKQPAPLSGAVSLPTFKGDGLRPGVNLDDSRSVRRLLDDSGKISQFS